MVVFYGDEMLICFFSSVTSSLASIKDISFFSSFSSFKRFILLLAFSSFKNLGMDSNPYNTHPSNFVDLLNSQQDVVFGLGEDSVHVSSSKVPLYGTPRSEDPHLGETPAERKERRTWTPTDDQVLISAWLNTSKDPVVENE